VSKADATADAPEAAGGELHQRGDDRQTHTDLSAPTQNLHVVSITSALMRDEIRLDEFKGCADAAALNGRWIATDAELGGVRLPGEVLSELTLHLKAGRFVFGNDSGIIAVDLDHRPHALDVVATAGPNYGRFVPAIFEQAGGMLRVCYDLSGRERPREFRAPLGTRRFLVTYRRAPLMTALPREHRTSTAP
jgi:uncharacterized protein (TIGR03067 family)